MAGIFTKAKLVLRNPDKLLESIRKEGIKEAFTYLLVLEIIFSLIINSAVSWLLFPQVFLGSLTVLYTVGFFILGLLSLFVVAFFVQLGVRILGGKGKYSATYKALVYGSTPSIVFTFLITLPLLATIGSISPEAFATGAGFGPQIYSFLAGLAITVILALIFGIWSLYLQSKGLGKLHGFSGWRGFASILIGGIILAVIALVIAFIAIIFFLSAFLAGGNFQQFPGGNFTQSTPTMFPQLPVQEWKLDSATDEFTIVFANRADAEVIIDSVEVTIGRDAVTNSTTNWLKPIQQIAYIIPMSADYPANVAYTARVTITYTNLNTGLQMKSAEVITGITK